MSSLMSRSLETDFLNACDWDTASPALPSRAKLESLGLPTSPTRSPSNDVDREATCRGGGLWSALFLIKEIPLPLLGNSHVTD